MCPARDVFSVGQDRGGEVAEAGPEGFGHHAKETDCPQGSSDCIGRLALIAREDITGRGECGQPLRAERPPPRSNCHSW